MSVHALRSCMHCSETERRILCSAVIDVGTNNMKLRGDKFYLVRSYPHT